MYILKDKNNNILSYSKNLKIIKDAEILANIPETIIEETQEEIVFDNHKAYLKSDWENYTKSEEYKYAIEKEKAQKEIDILKKELEEDDYKIIKAFESSLNGDNPPYDMEELSKTRNSKRLRINELQTSFSLN